MKTEVNDIADAGALDAGTIGYFHHLVDVEVSDVSFGGAGKEIVEFAESVGVPGNIEIVSG